VGWIFGRQQTQNFFIVINSLFPISFYLGNNTYFPGMVILINSGLILFLVLIVQIIAKTTLKEKINLFLKQAKPSVFFKIFLIVWAMYFINLFIFPILGIRKEYLIWLLCLLFVFWFFEQKIKVNIFYIVAGIIFFSLFTPFLLNINFFTIDFFLCRFTFIYCYFCNACSNFSKFFFVY